MPTQDALRRYYARYYDGRESGVTFDRPDSFARHIWAKARLPIAGRRVSVLDFGGGDGSLSQAVASCILAGGAKFVSIALVDYGQDPWPVGGASSVSIERQPSLETLSGCHFDLVLASAVIEHIPYPRPVLTQLLGLLRPGGVFYARTPSVASLFRLFQSLRLSFDFTYPAHVHDLGEKFWDGVLQHLPLAGEDFAVIAAGPSPVETAFRKHPLRTGAALLMKAPWLLLRSGYPFVGGWEIFIQRIEVRS